MNVYTGALFLNAETWKQLRFINSPPSLGEFINKVWYI